MQEEGEVVLRDLAPEVAEAELRLKLPKLQRELHALEGLKKVDSNTLRIEFTV